MSGIPSWAVKGRKVVCIADEAMIARGRANNPWGHFPNPGGIYTIRSTVVGTNGVCNLRLVEIVNPPMCSTVGETEWGFPSRYFKPLVTIEDDISTHFAALLDVKQPSPVSA